VTLQKYFSHPSSVTYFSWTSPIKTATGTANRWGTINSKPLGPIIMIQVRSSLLRSSLQVYSAAAPFISHLKLYNYAEPNRHCFTFLYPILVPCGTTYWAMLEMLLGISKLGSLLIVHNGMLKPLPNMFKKAASEPIILDWARLCTPNILGKGEAHSMALRSWVAASTILSKKVSCPQTHFGRCYNNHIWWNSSTPLLGLNRLWHWALL